MYVQLKQFYYYENLKPRSCVYSINTLDIMDQNNQMCTRNINTERKTIN